MHKLSLAVILLALLVACSPQSQQTNNGNSLHITMADDKESISVFRGDEKEPILVQHVKPGFRPYLHPITAPDGKGTITEFSPGHHKHQTGLYWGFTRVNGRDYFHHPEKEYWRKVSATILADSNEIADSVTRWQTVYDLLDEQGNAVLTETQVWSLKTDSGRYILDLEWSGLAKTDITIGKYDYGGLFLRMPWKEGIKGEVVNAARQRNERAEGQPAMWVDVGMQVEGRDDLAHVAIFDHPDNEGYPQMWRVDNELGVGPVRARAGDWHIKNGQTETIRHRMLIYTGEHNEQLFAKVWQDFTGETAMNSSVELWDIARREGREAKFLTPEEAVKAMTINENYQVNAWASEPMITQPMAFCWDDRGRLWIAENLDYESRGHGFSNDGNSRILILEDTNHDGKADKRKVFLQGIPFPSAIAVGFDGLFLGAPPNLLFVPDRDNDDVADVKDIEVRLTGWGIRDRHETLNSFHWGPDGWLYGLQGFATPSKIRKPVGKGRIYKAKEPFPENILDADGVDINGGVWRYHPVKDRFEVVAHGFSNPWGIDYDAKGQLFISACVIPHLWHVIPGGIYHRQGGQHFNPYIYNDIKTIADHSHRSAHGGARVYLSDAFPASQRGRIFMANIHEHAVLSDQLIRNGSGFIGKHGEDFMLANNAQFIGFSMEIGPEGALYVLDWHDADICGEQVLNKETGRVYRINPKNSAAKNWPGRYDDLNKMSDAQLVQLQTSTSEWHARRARLILQNRAMKKKLAPSTHEQLRKILESEKNADYRLRALWSLHVTGGFTAPQLVALLDDSDEYIRAWAIQLLTEDKQPAPGLMQKLVQMGQADRSAVVRLYLASALQRMDISSRWQLAENLVMHAEDTADHNIPKMLWTAVEPLVKQDPGRMLSIAAKGDIGMIARFTARRVIDADAIETLIGWLSKAPKNVGNFLEGMRDGMEGRFDMTAPASWKNVYTKLSQSPDPNIRNLASAVSRQFGDTETALKLMNTVKDKSVSTDQRRQALNALAERRRKELIPELPHFIDDPSMRMDAIKAVAAFDDESLGKLLLEKYNHFDRAEKLQVVQTMSSRPRYGWMLTTAMKRKNIPKSDVPAYAARQLVRVVGSGFVEVYGPVDEENFDQQAYNKYKKLLSDEALSKANPLHGKVVFQQTCGPCHKLYGEGGAIGPDLTGSNRSNVDYLLSNVLNPSGEIQDDYKMTVITTRDGRTYAGNIVSETPRQVTMRIVGKESLIITKSNIQSRETTNASMMPTGLFSTLQDKDVLELVAYLRSHNQ